MIPDRGDEVSIPEEFRNGWFSYSEGEPDSGDDSTRTPWGEPDKREKKPSEPSEKKPDEGEEQKAARGGAIPNPTDQDRARHLHGFK